VRSGTPVSVVTGGTDGIGRAIALQLACAGHRVIVVGRDTKRGATVVREMAAVAARPQASEPPVFLSADLSSMVATASLADRITALTDRLDALVCCAGAFALRPAWTSEGMERSFALNYLSRFLLINRLLPDLERSPSGRVLLVANAGRYRDTLQLQDLEHGHARRGLRLAGSTQFANDVLAVELAERYRHTRLEVTCVYPGIVRTDLFRHAVGVPPRLAAVLTRVAASVGLPPEVAAETPAALAADPKVRGVSGQFFGPTLSPIKVPRRVRRPDRRAQIWAASEQLVLHATRDAVPFSS
jgi:NAD(P)-dependent dehydrogenase (short-subunit alcohol dehydrogenase family)